MKQIETLTRVLRDKEIEVEQKPLDLGLLRRMFAGATAHNRQRNKLLAVVIIRGIQLPTLDFILSKWVIGAIITSHYLDILPWGVGAYILWAGLTQFTMHFRMRWAQEYGEAVVHDLRNAIFGHLQTLTMGYFHRTRIGRNISRVTSDSEQIRQGVQDLLFMGCVNVGQMLFASIFMFYLDRMLFLVLAAMAPGLWIFNRIYKKFVSRAVRQTQESFSRVTSSVSESVAGIRVTQSFVRQDVNAKMFHDLVSDHAVYNINMARNQGLLGPVLDFNNQGFVALLLLLGGWRALHHATDVSNLIAFIWMGVNSFFGPLQTLGNLYNNAMTSMAGAERVFNLLDTKPDFEDPPNAIELKPCRGDVEFRNLTFGYKPDVPVLRNVSFHASAGETVALVGHTGSGKSTIINLITKFYLPTAGELLIDGVEVRQLSTASLASQIGIVLQVNFLFTGTVMENIRLGKLGASDEEVIGAAERLGCRDLFEALPQGFNTYVGERGAGLSLGQRQLVCFSRAMLADPRIFILDEATSSIDTMTEHRVQQSLQRLLKGRTCFIVAHRLSTIRHANQVLVLDQGQIIERGTHRDLLALGGTYAKLYRQFIRQQ